ncbi:MAG: RagB/SusD family nutrient uptake outer membrane protein, partial [Bacteroidaceae bacterium]
MKKNPLSIIFILIFLMTSCDDSLDRFPLDGFSPENYFNNEIELKTYSNQFYSMLPSAGSGYGENSDVIINFTLSPEIQGSRVIPNSGAGWDWGMLHNINLMLQYSYRCKNTEIREQYEGIARFFRAWFYFEK